MTTGLPQAAIDAAKRERDSGWYRSAIPDEVIERLLEAAAPHIVAAERERIRRLILAEAPRYALGHTALRNVASLLAGPEEPTP